MELQILHFFEGLHNPVCNVLMYAITMIGEAGIIWILAAAAMIFFFPRQYRKVGITVLIALLISLIMCNGVMKNMFHRVRPFRVDDTLENVFGIFNTIYDWSFPSGHTSSSFAAAVAIFLWKKKEGAAALVLAVLIAFSRLYLTVHYPTDVLASLLLGSLYGVIAYVLVHAYDKKKNITDGSQTI